MSTDMANNDVPQAEQEAQAQQEASPPAPPKPQSVWTLEFTTLMLLAIFANLYVAVFYSFEQWLVLKSIGPQWRGLILGSMGLAVLSTRSFVSVWLMRHRGFVLMAMALLVNSLILVAYTFVDTPEPIMGLRILHGVCFAVINSVAMSALVECIPDGQSTRAFALFSLTRILPYSIAPAVSEFVLPSLSDPSHLYAYTALLGLPSLIGMYIMAKRLPKKPPSSDGKEPYSLWQVISNMNKSGLFLVFASVGFVACAYFTTIFYMKGLCLDNGTNPAVFFGFYTGCIILTRFLGAKVDQIPRIPGIMICVALSALAFVGFAYGPGWMLIPLAIVYGTSMGIGYPMISATVYDMSSKETRSINANTMMLFFDAANVVGSIIGGNILDFGGDYHDVFFSGFVYMVLILICMVFFAPKWRRRHEFI